MCGIALTVCDGVFTVPVIVEGEDGVVVWMNIGGSQRVEN